MITEAQKTEIKELLDAYVAKFPSQKKAANSINGVSEATVINIRKGKWEGITDELWRTLLSQVRSVETTEWKVAPTKSFNTMVKLLDNAREYSLIYAITAQEGHGKSQTTKWFKDNRPNVYRLECADYFNKKLFLSELMREMGLENSGTVGEMMESIVRFIRRQQIATIILDEIDKLPDPSLYFFITLSNKLQDECAIITTSTDYFEKRILKGIRLNKKGYKEIYSRLGRNFIELGDHKYEDVRALCEANGVFDTEEIHKISNSFEGDMRRAKRSIHAYRMKQSTKSIQKVA